MSALSTHTLSRVRFYLLQRFIVRLHRRLDFFVCRLFLDVHPAFLPFFPPPTLFEANNTLLLSK